MRKIFAQPFIAITLFFIVGLLVGSLLDIPFWPIVIMLCIVTVSLLLLRKRPLVLVVLLLILFGIFRYSLIEIYPSNHITHFIDQLGIEKVLIEGKIINEPAVYPDKISCIVKLSHLENVPVEGNILLTIKDIGPEKAPCYGDHILYKGTIFRPLTNNNPFSFNYQEYLQNNNIFGLSYLYKPQYEITSHSKNLYYYLVVIPRNWIRHRIDRFYPVPYAGFLKAVLLGEKNFLPPQLKKDFAASGLSHILAVSGLHTGVIALIFLTILQIIFRNRTVARWLTIFLLIYYMLLAHAVPSVQRAVIMISLVLLAKIFQRRANTINILFAAGFIILFINPLQLFSIGFQLSFISVFSILVIFQYVSRILKPLRQKYSWLFWLINLILLSLMVQIALAPLTIHYFHTLALGGIIANVFAIPLISLILPLSILSLLFPVPAICAMYAAANKLMLFIVFQISHFITQHKILFFDFLYLSTTQVIILYAALIVFILYWNKQESMRIKTYKCIAFLVVIVSILIIPDLVLERNFEITVLDVGQGDAIVLRTPGHHTILIDTGDKTLKKDYGEMVVVPYFKSHGIRNIDLLVLTHPHADHIGGVETVVDNISIEKVLLPRCEYESSLYDSVLSSLKGHDIEMVFADTSLIFEEFKPVTLQILHPTYEYRNETNVNNYSVVIKAEYDDFSILFTGDAEHEVESLLIDTWGNTLDSDVLKVGHHGSSSSSTLEFLEYVTPDYAVISVGAKNRYDHPDEKIILRLDNSVKELFRTDRDGAVIFSSEGTTLRIKTIVSEKEIINGNIKKNEPPGKRLDSTKSKGGNYEDPD